MKQIKYTYIIKKVSILHPFFKKAYKLPIICKLFNYIMSTPLMLLKPHQFTHRGKKINELIKNTKNMTPLLQPCREMCHYLSI